MKPYLSRHAEGQLLLYLEPLSANNRYGRALVGQREGQDAFFPSAICSVVVVAVVVVLTLTL